jgi:hypothetical protein
VSGAVFSNDTRHNFRDTVYESFHFQMRHTALLHKGDFIEAS